MNDDIEVTMRFIPAKYLLGWVYPCGITLISIRTKILEVRYEHNPPDWWGK